MDGAVADDRGRRPSAPPAAIVLPGRAVRRPDDPRAARANARPISRNGPDVSRDRRVCGARASARRGPDGSLLLRFRGKRRAARAGATPSTTTGWTRRPRTRPDAVRRRAQHHQRADGLASGRRLRSLPRAGPAPSHVERTWRPPSRPQDRLAFGRCPRGRRGAGGNLRRGSRQAYRRHGDGLGSVDGHAREIALYRLDDPVLRAHTPAVIATHADPKTRTWAVLLEDLRDATLLDSADRPGAWTPDHVSAVVDGIAADSRRVALPRRRVARPAMDAGSPNHGQRPGDDAACGAPSPTTPRPCSPSGPASHWPPRNMP